MYGKKVRLRIVFIISVLTTIILSVYIILKLLEDKNLFIADKILAKHDENYMPPEVKESLEQK